MVSMKQWYMFSEAIKANVKYGNKTHQMCEISLFEASVQACLEK